jgi:hypothetical protein
MQPVVEEGPAPGGLQRAVFVVVVFRLAAFGVELEALELLVGDEVDGTADRIRALRGGRAAGHHVDPLDQ